MKPLHTAWFVSGLLVTSMVGCKGCHQSATVGSSSAAGQEASPAEKPQSTQESGAPAQESSASQPGQADSADDRPAKGGGSSAAENTGTGNPGVGNSGTDNSEPAGTNGSGATGAPGASPGSGSAQRSPAAAAPPKLAPPKFKTPENAYQYAVAQQSVAAGEAADKKNSAAYSGVLKGWQALQPHLGDSRCRQLSAELLVEMEAYGEQLSPLSQPLIGKPLKIK